MIKGRKTVRREGGISMQENAKQRVYAAIDLKSFYASVECIERDWTPLPPTW